MNIFTNNPDFYPTPREVIEKMMLNEYVAGKTVLEPSAGKGDIVEWLQEQGATVIACENDPNIRKLLNGKCDIIADDFLTVTSEQVSHVDYIVMNPPFSHGAEHILHAWEIAPPGCTIVALCNDSNLEHWRSSTFNEKLKETITLYGQDEYLGSCFENSERKTDVIVSLIKLYKEGEGEDEWSNYFFSEVDDDEQQTQRNGIMHYNVVRDIVNRYKSAVQLFDETLAAANKINELAAVPDAYRNLPIKFCVKRVQSDGYTYYESEVSYEQYKRDLKKYYWKVLFDKLNLEKHSTRKLKKQINKFIEHQSHVPFTMYNIYRVIDMVIQTTGQRMQSALIEAFDNICSLSAENSTAGAKWKTNANYMVNKRFISDWITEVGWHGEMRIRDSSNYEKIEDLVKALCYITGIKYEKIESLDRYVSNNNKPWGKWFYWAFFRVRGYKKGTMHFEFLDENVWMKFNMEVAKLKGWELPKKSEKPKRSSAAETVTPEVVAEPVPPAPEIITMPA